MDELIKRFIDEYMTPIFYFSLKRTNNEEKARDLTQDIALEVIKAINADGIINNFHAYVWRIARNCYSKWAKKKVLQNEMFVFNDFNEIDENITDGSDIADGILHNEQQELLYRELALLSYDYNKIIVSYYFENKSVDEIAGMLRLPNGTIKRKLYECRQKMKEGMNMARTYGKRSFQPEQIRFLQNANMQAWQKDGSYYIERITPQNILLEAYDNPSTAEDLSLSLGIAMPYMEDEIRILTEAELLICENGKYKTNIVILSKKAQDELYDLKIEIGKSLSPLVIKAVDSIDKAKLPKNQSFDDMKMSLMVLLIDSLGSKTNNPIKSIHTIKRADGGEWALMGYENTDKTIPETEMWGTEMFGYNPNGQILLPPLYNGKKYRKPTINEADIPVFEKLDEILELDENKSIIKLLNDYLAKAKIILDTDIPEYLWGKSMVTSDMSQFRTLALQHAIDTGYIVLPKDMNKSAMGIWLYK
ncbi:MAG: sigma-70 family RNA polymerase sigma factor [Oscillospiraceae bacterium]|nr:sigma-70 family RNA polymerase sigma factor [Oscillospiraceae bacterium]